MNRRNGPRPNGRTSSNPDSRYLAKALQGASAPPKLPAFEAHRFGSISLCGGATSNCAYPQRVSDGKNMRSCFGAFNSWACNPVNGSTKAASNANDFIQPPKNQFLRSRARRHWRGIGIVYLRTRNPFIDNFPTENHIAVC